MPHVTINNMTDANSGSTTALPFSVTDANSGSTMTLPFSVTVANSGSTTALPSDATDANSSFTTALPFNATDANSDSGIYPVIIDPDPERPVVPRTHTTDDLGLPLSPLPSHIMRGIDFSRSTGVLLHPTCGFLWTTTRTSISDVAAAALPASKRNTNKIVDMARLLQQSRFPCLHDDRKENHLVRDNYYAWQDPVGDHLS